MHRQFKSSQPHAESPNTGALSLASGLRPGLALWVAISLGLLGCAPEPKAEPEFETVELGGTATDNLRPDEDVTEAVGSQGFAGQLPAGFPSDLPVPPSSSVVSAARGSVTFGTEDSADGARSQLTRELARAGWTDAGDRSYSKGGRTARITFTEEAERTLVRYRY